MHKQKQEIDTDTDTDIDTETDRHTTGSSFVEVEDWAYQKSFCTAGSILQDGLDFTLNGPASLTAQRFAVAPGRALSPV